jgi:hypothetical protein
VGLVEVGSVIPEKRLVLLSPHYDDVPLTWGGYLDAARRGGALADKCVRVVNVFSRSVYQARDDEGNRDTSLARQQYATGIRLMEDVTCLDAVLGAGGYGYELKLERECVVRQKAWKPGERFEFPQGNRETFDDEEWEIFASVKGYAVEWLERADTALLLPLCVKEHVDHVILREAVLERRAEMGDAARARLYFGEDQPYAGLGSEEDWRTAQEFVARLGLEPLDYAIDAERKSELVMTSYPSQVEDSYREGMVERSRQLAELNGVSGGVERIWRAP